MKYSSIFNRPKSMKTDKVDYRVVLHCFLFLLLLIAGSACEEDNEMPYLEVEFDRMEFTDRDSTTIFTLAANMDWKVETDGSDWVTLYNASGKASSARQPVGINIKANDGPGRQATIIAKAGDLVKRITIMQSITVLKFGMPELSDGLYMHASLDGNIVLNIPYTKAAGNESFTVSVSVSGTAAGGIDNVSDFPVAVTEASGIIPIPLTGAPETIGDVTFHITSTYSDAVIASLAAIVKPMEVAAPLLSKEIVSLTPLADTWLLIPYSRAGGDESFTVSVTMSGAAAAGINPVTDFQVTLSQSADTIRIPLTGTPAKAGAVRFLITTTYPGVLIDPLNASVVPFVYFSMDFNLMVLGGDIIGRNDGTTLDTDKTPWEISTGEINLPANPIYKPCTQGTLPLNFFGTGPGQASGAGGLVSESYKTLRGLIGDWSGLRMYEQPGYVTFGTSSGSGWVLTPALSNISGTKDVTVTFKVGRSATSNLETKVTVSVSDNGGTMETTDPDATVSGLAINGFDFPIITANKWETKTFTITGANSSTRLRFENTTNATGFRNFSLDDILVFQE
jgi:hypothetical protein